MILKKIILLLKNIDKKYFLISLLGVVLGGGIAGGLYLKGNTINPYQLDYKKIIFKLPIIRTVDLTDKMYPIGEKYLSEDMANAFKKFGYTSRLSSLEDFYSYIPEDEGIEIFFRCHPEFDFEYKNKKDKDRIAVVFETFPFPEDCPKRADIIFTPSYKKLNEYRNLGLNVHFIPQFTDFNKFYPEFDENLKGKVLFVGNKYPEEVAGLRKSIKYAIRNNIDVDIYGANWDKLLTQDKKSLLKGVQIAGNELHKYYSSYDIVLNDTRDDMIEAGIISNRIFDVTASGGFVISDYVEEIERVYGDSVPMYKTEEEFVYLINYYLSHPEERQEKARRAHEITLQNFGIETVLKTMIEKIDDYKQQKGL